MKKNQKRYNNKVFGKWCSIRHKKFDNTKYYYGNITYHL